jgi:hypothetical protein
VNEVTHLAPDEPLSPELVLVLPPELRAQALARLGPPVWPAPRKRVHEVPRAEAEPFALALGTLLLTRVAQLGFVFLAVTIVTLVMSVVAYAFR